VWTQTDVIKATGAVLAAGVQAAGFTGVAIDSRVAGPGDLYVSIVGDRNDGHGFVPELLGRGNKGFVIRGDRVEKLPAAMFTSAGAACFVVPDTLLALQDLAAFHRRRLDVRVLGITGTCGKTTTKEMVAAVFETTFATHKTRGNLNNHIGVPLTLLALSPSHQWAVVEMGMNHPGEIRRLAQIAAPGIGMITNVLPGHLEGVGSLEGVAAAKKELLEEMSGGTAILNHDDERVRAMAKGFAGQVFFFGTGPGVDIRVHSVRQSGSGMDLAVSTPSGEVRAHLDSFGPAMASNACAAVAAGFVAGIQPDKIAAGLQTWAPISGRLQVARLSNGAGLLDDTYNANPGSVAAAIRTVISLKNQGRAYLVLGDMMELGDHAVAEHEAIGKLAAQEGIDGIYACGAHAQAVARGASQAGMPESAIFLGAKDVLVERLAARLRSQDWVLVKGSRLMGMEEAVTGLKAAFLE